jgi:tetratricopeptide (TPR) repeat protein
LFEDGQALSQFSQEKYQLAEANDTKALELDADFAPAHTGLGAIAGAEGRYEDTVEHHVAALRINKDSAMSHWGIAVGLWQLGESEEAVSHFKTFIRLMPNASQRAYAEEKIADWARERYEGRN